MKRAPQKYVDKDRAIILKEIKLRRAQRLLGKPTSMPIPTELNPEWVEWALQNNVEF